MDGDDVDTRLVRAFLAVAQHGTFTRAAGVLGVSQQAVSQQVRRLEDLLGQRLFVRHGAGVALTAKGFDLRPQAEALVRATDVLFRRARGPRASSASGRSAAGT
ncbi:LysR family transcriptional regulator [Raineyella fluvialis]|uniref:LysR family transcriptional regulator n=1 Tax=Raineyella fluvialis TaxID=2662261 RepID=A0A5Q2FD86_9ACTN|nr:LysR family transcriptional regulator [Raineyella fluvialis]QGF22675.1 LysR family transcriptional regulator [Raineyella fluvialis]